MRMILALQAELERQSKRNKRLSKKLKQIAAPTSPMNTRFEARVPIEPPRALKQLLK